MATRSKTRTHLMEKSEQLSTRERDLPPPALDEPVTKESVVMSGKRVQKTSEVNSHRRKPGSETCGSEKSKLSRSRKSVSSNTTELPNSDVDAWFDQMELDDQRVQRPEDFRDAPIPPATELIPPGTDGPIQQLAAAIQQLAVTNQSNNLLSRLSTPRDLPIFSGDPMEWLQFQQAYNESTELCKFTDNENVWRLRRCLRGPAREAVSSLLVTRTSPEIVMSTLRLQFGNPDIILHRIVTDIKRLSPLPLDYHKDIIKFSIKVNNYVAAVRALGQDEYLQGLSVVTLVLGKLPTVLISKWSDYYADKVQEHRKCRLIMLSEFLHEEAVKLSQSGAHLLNLRSESSYKKHYNEPYSQTLLMHSKSEQGDKCRFCRVSVHKLSECRKFKKALRKDRWQFVRRGGICYKCLISHHDKEACPAPVCDVENCGQNHHRLLHYVPAPRQNSPARVSESEPERETETQVETVAHVNANSCVLLKTVPIKIHGQNGDVDTVALIDEGSTVTMISAGLAARAGLSGRSETMQIRGAWESADLVCQTQLVTVTVSNKQGARFSIDARSVPNLNLPKQDLTLVNCDNFNHLKTVKNDLFIGQCKPEVLIGQDNYHLILPLESKVGSPKEPCATRTPLGWCVHGRAPTRSGAPARPLHSTLFVSSDDDPGLLRELHTEVRHFFSFDSMGVSAKPRQNAEEVRALDILERTSNLKNGEWHISLPWKDENCTMPDSLPLALARLKGVEIKMNRDHGFAQRYLERVKHLFDNGYARQLTNEEIASTKENKLKWYLPHFGVDNPNKKKLRLVFDAAAKVAGMSLNDYLITGPDLLQSLFGIMLRFRENKIAVSGDIKDMFLRVKLNPADQHACRFIFRDSETQSVNTYMMTSLIFGATSSPFVAQFVKNKNAGRFKVAMPNAYEAITKSHYMDDYIDSIQDEATAIQLVRDVTHIHMQGNFEMRNWTSNSEAVLNSIPKEALGDVAVRLKTGQLQELDGERTLGLIWYPREDVLKVDISLKRIPECLLTGVQKPTKRQILKIVMSIFDVYGLLSPITITGKIIFQECWLTKIGWDDHIPADIYVRWTSWMNLLVSLREACLQLPRWYWNASASETKDVSMATFMNLQLHTFCDASKQAICAVSYWRWNDSEGQIFVAFIASKCRVVPVKPTTTVPRLELQASVLGVRLADTLTREHRIKPIQRFFWCDSSTVLHWVRNDARNYKEYIANRLGEIDELSLVKEWYYVPSKMNVADIATRENYDFTALEGEWLHGPAFLRGGKDDWPTDVTQPAVNKADTECCTLLIFNKEQFCVPEPERFSSWLRLVRTTYVVLKFINKLRKIPIDDSALMEKAELLLLRYSQAQSFDEELCKIKNGEYLPKSSRLLNLSPYLDELGVLRVAGRIDAAVAVAPETKRPIILDGHNYITRLIVRAYHIHAAHSNQELIVNQLKQKYWVIRLRPTVRGVASKCMTCRLKKSKPEIPRMGDLPEARMAHHQRPFSFCGVDLFGPIDISIGRRREKRYGVLFTCLTVRAVHIEIVSSLSADVFIMALRRMAARRGWPQQMFSDNGTNLRGADAELKKSILELDREALKLEALNRGLKWTFIPPASPHWGGAWERLIRSIKNTLKVILKERAPREETLITLLAEVENIINSRPLLHEPGSTESLTPNHFLLGSSSNLPAMGVFDEREQYLRKQWRISQILADQFWRRWVREVLPQMLPRTRWQNEHRNLNVGDLVLIADPNSPRNMWPRGLVAEVEPGKDGRVRMVRVKTKSGVLTRSVTRVVRIPIGVECC